MKNYLSILIAVFLLAGISCQQKETKDSYEEVAKELDLVYSTYLQAWGKGNIATCMSLMSKDYVNYPSYGSTQNYQKVEKMFHNVFDYFKISDVKYERIELFVHDNMAYEFGYFEQQLAPKNGQETRHAQSRCITVFKKDEDGKWKLHRWMAQAKKEES